MNVCTVVNSKGKISQNFLAFSECMNFTYLHCTINYFLSAQVYCIPSWLYWKGSTVWFRAFLANFSIFFFHFLLEKERQRSKKTKRMLWYKYFFKVFKLPDPKIFFASFAWKLGTNYVLEWIGLNFYDYDGLEPTMNHTKHYWGECIVHNILVLTTPKNERGNDKIAWVYLY